MELNEERLKVGFKELAAPVEQAGILESVVDRGNTLRRRRRVLRVTEAVVAVAALVLTAWGVSWLVRDLPSVPVVDTPATTAVSTTIAHEFNTRVQLGPVSIDSFRLEELWTRICEEVGLTQHGATLEDFELGFQPDGTIYSLRIQARTADGVSVTGGSGGPPLTQFNVYGGPGQAGLLHTSGAVDLDTAFAAIDGVGLKNLVNVLFDPGTDGYFGFGLPSRDSEGQGHLGGNRAFLWRDGKLTALPTDDALRAFGPDTFVLMGFVMRKAGPDAGTGDSSSATLPSSSTTVIYGSGSKSTDSAYFVFSSVAASSAARISQWSEDLMQRVMEAAQAYFTAVRTGDKTRFLSLFAPADQSAATRLYAQELQALDDGSAKTMVPTAATARWRQDGSWFLGPPTGWSEDSEDWWSNVDPTHRLLVEETLASGEHRLLRVQIRDGEPFLVADEEIDYTPLPEEVDTARARLLAEQLVAHFPELGLGVDSAVELQYPDAPVTQFVLAPAGSPMSVLSITLSQNTTPSSGIDENLRQAIALGKTSEDVQIPGATEAMLVRGPGWQLVALLPNGQMINVVSAGTFSPPSYTVSEKDREGVIETATFLAGLLK